MNPEQQALAEHCLRAAETGAMTFPQIVAALGDGGFEGYAVDFRRATTTYYLPTGSSVELRAHDVVAPIAPVLDAAALQAAIREAQTLAPGYTYKGFCGKAKAAGCAGYAVSFPGRRAVYFGRDGATHTELFPGAA